MAIAKPVNNPYAIALVEKTTDVAVVVQQCQEQN